MEANIPLYLTLITVLFVALLVFLTYVSTSKIPSTKKVNIYKQIEAIKQTLAENNPYASRDVIVRLDSLLSKSLQIRYQNSATCGDNLTKSKKLLGKDIYESIWYYHKMRNSIVHENIEIKSEDAKKAYSVYTKVITKILS